MQLGREIAGSAEETAERDAVAGSAVREDHFTHESVRF